MKNTRFIYDNILANENCRSNVNTFLFVPCNAKEQLLCCSLLNLPSVVKPCNVSRIPQQLGKPSKLFKTQGDGNCLFRAISYSVARRQVYHYIVRNKIVEHMLAVEDALRPHLNSSLDDYLAHGGMKKQNIWGTDIVILTASSLLQTDIYVYTKVGSGYKWQKFSSSMLDEDPPQNKGALYLQNTAGVHYDVVVKVNTNVDDFSNTIHNYSDRNQYTEGLGAASFASGKQTSGRRVNTENMDTKTLENHRISSSQSRV